MLRPAAKRESFAGRLLLSSALVAVSLAYGWWQRQNMQGPHVTGAASAPHATAPQASASALAPPPVTASEPAPAAAPARTLMLEARSHEAQTPHPSHAGLACSVSATSHRPAIPPPARKIRAACRQSFRVSRRASAWQIFLKPAGHARHAMSVDLIPFQARHALDELDAASPHGERRGGITIGLHHIGADDGEADDIVRAIAAGVRVIDMVAAQIIARSGDAAAPGYQHLDDLIGLERIADTHRPVFAFVIDAMTLDVAPGRDAEIREAHSHEL